MADNANSNYSEEVHANESNTESQALNSNSGTATDSVLTNDEHSKELDSDHEDTPLPVIYKLHDAAIEFNVKEVEKLLSLGYDVNEKDENGRNAVYTMLSKYITLNMVEKIHAKPQYIEILSILARSGLDINSCDNLKQTVLHFIAAQGNNVDIIKPLLAAGSRVNSQDAKSHTPLHAAILKGHAANVQVLVEGGADTDIGDRSGEAGLHMLCKGKRKLKLIQLLLRCGAKINVRDSGGRTPLHVATKYSRHEHVIELLNSGAKLNARDTSGQTPLHYAMKFDMTGAIVAELLDRKAEINMSDSIAEETALHKTITYRTVESFKHLIQHRPPPNPNAKDMLGETPLHRAAANCQDIYVWKQLLKLGGDVSIQNENGFTPVQKALRVKNAVALSLLREHGAYVSSY